MTTEYVPPHVGFKTLAFKNNQLIKLIDKMSSVESELYEIHGFPLVYSPPFSYPSHSFWPLSPKTIELLESFTNDDNIVIRPLMTPLSCRVIKTVLVENKEEIEHDIHIQFQPIHFFQTKLKDRDHADFIFKKFIGVFNFPETNGIITPELLNRIYEETITSENGISEEFFTELKELIKTNSEEVQILTNPVGPMNDVSMTIKHVNFGTVLEFAILQPMEELATIMFICNLSNYGIRTEQFISSLSDDFSIVN